MSRWLVALGALCLLTPAAAGAAGQARSAPAARPATAVAAPEASPLLLSDPSTGAAIRIWSRSDGFTTKIAWARNDGSGWGAPHDLTFGLGVDHDPAVAVTSAGAWLFWRDDRGVVFYAPLEIGSGRLLGVPSALAIGAGLAGGPRPEGGTDVPIVTTCDPTDASCILQRQKPPSNPGQPNPTAPPVMGGDGGSDVPVMPASATSIGPTLTTAADPTCERSFVSVVQGDAVLVAELDAAGRVRSQHTVLIGKGVTPEQAGPAAAQFYMIKACGN